jgi:hypothetical protein
MNLILYLPEDFVSNVVQNVLEVNVPSKYSSITKSSTCLATERCIPLIANFKWIHYNKYDVRQQRFKRLNIITLLLTRHGIPCFCISNTFGCLINISLLHFHANRLFSLSRNHTDTRYVVLPEATAPDCAARMRTNSCLTLSVPRVKSLCAQTDFTRLSCFRSLTRRPY